MPQRIVFSEPILSSPQAYPSRSARYRALDARSEPTGQSPPTFDLFTLTWLLSFLAFFFVTDNHMRTRRHNQAKWYDLQTSKAAYIYECKPAASSSREKDDAQKTSRAEASREEPGMLARAWDGLTLGASMMMAA